MDARRAEGFLRLTREAQKIARCLADATGLTVSELNCMMQLYGEKSCGVRKLTEMLGIRTSSTSKLLRSLDARGWLTRELDPADRRMVRVVLTEQGVEAARQILQTADSIAVTVLERLPADCRVHFTECINTITQRMITIPNNNSKGFSYESNNQ